MLLDTQNVFVNDLGAGLTHSFFGWPSSGGDVITKIEYDMNGIFEGLDDFRFGQVRAPVSVEPVPEPATMLLFGSRLIGLATFQNARVSSFSV